MNKLFGPLGGLVDMVVGNPFTSAPGVLLILKSGGAMLVAIGTCMTDVGNAQSLSGIWNAVSTLAANPDAGWLLAGIMGIAAKDFNVTGGTKQQ